MASAVLQWEAPDAPAGGRWRPAVPRRSSAPTAFSVRRRAGRGVLGSQGQAAATITATTTATTTT